MRRQPSGYLGLPAMAFGSLLALLVNQAPAISTSASTVPQGACAGPGLSPGQFNADLVDRSPKGTTFCISTGVHLMTRPILAKTNQRFVGEVGSILDFKNLSSAYCFYGYQTGGNQDNVTVQSLSIRNCTKGHAIKTGKAWTLDGNTIERSSVGVTAGTGSTVRNNRIIYNSGFGWRGAGNDILFEGNEVAFNGGTRDSGGSTGAMKAVGTSAGIYRITVRQNHVHDNKGPGVWADGNVHDMVVEGNRITNNTGSGIIYEISWGGVARHNVLTGNASAYRGKTCWWAADIHIQNSEGVTVHDNTIDASAGENAICAADIVRSASYPTYPEKIEPFSAHDNVIILGETTNIGAVGSEHALTVAATSFRNNDYLGSPANKAHWQWRSSPPQNFAWWRALGQDGAEGGGQ